MKLDEIVSEFDDDITNPNHMDNVLMYLEEIKAQDNAYMDLLLIKLRFEIVTWEQPWYQKTYSLTRPVKTTEDTENDFRTETMTKAESLHVQKRWKKLCKKYELPDTPECFARWKSKGKCKKPSAPEECVRKFVVSYVAKGLQRTLSQVYKHMRILYAYPNKYAYTKTEEQIMRICFHHNPVKACRYLSCVLGREPRGIYKRLHQLFEGKPEKKKLKWTLPLASKFLNLLLKYTGSKLEDLKYKHIDKSVWIKLQDDIDQYYIYLQNFWYSKLHVQLFVKEDVKIKRLRKIILKRLRSTYAVWSDIRWKDVIKYAPDGFTHRFIYALILRLFPKHRKYTEPLAGLVNEALIRNKNIKYDRRLKTLILNSDGNLEIVKYDVKMGTHK